MGLGLRSGGSNRALRMVNLVISNGSPRKDNPQNGPRRQVVHDQQQRVRHAGPNGERQIRAAQRLLEESNRNIQDPRLPSPSPRPDEVVRNDSLPRSLPSQRSSIDYMLGSYSPSDSETSPTAVNERKRPRSSESFGLDDCSSPKRNCPSVGGPSGGGAAGGGSSSEHYPLSLVADAEDENYNMALDDDSHPNRGAEVSEGDAARGAAGGAIEEDAASTNNDAAPPADAPADEVGGVSAEAAPADGTANEVGGVSAEAGGAIEADAAAEEDDQSTPPQSPPPGQVFTQDDRLNQGPPNAPQQSTRVRGH